MKQELATFRGAPLCHMLVLAKELGFEAHSSGTELSIDERRLTIRAPSRGEANEDIQLVQ